MVPFAFRCLHSQLLSSGTTESGRPSLSLPLASTPKTHPDWIRSPSLSSRSSLPTCSTVNTGCKHPFVSLLDKMVGKDARFLLSVSLTQAQNFSKCGPELRHPWDPVRSSQGQNYFHRGTKILFFLFIPLGVFQKEFLYAMRPYRLNAEADMRIHLSSIKP